jgi:hypothetical protein
MPVPYRPEDDLADHFIDELTADLDADDARELAGELARMIDLGLLEVDDDLRIGVAERYALPPERPRPGTGPSGALGPSGVAGGSGSDDAGGALGPGGVAGGSGSRDAGGSDGADGAGARRVWQPASRRPDRWGVNRAGSSRRR